jgi:L-aminopeptidase/D-esterase-like protein
VATKEIKKKPVEAEARKQGRFEGSITQVKGIRVGHAQDKKARTGVTAVLCGPDSVGGVDVRGAAPGTRETDLLQPGNLVQGPNAILLCGGSAFGLAAAEGAMRFLRERGVGLDVGVGVVPIVPAAVLFDLGVGRADTFPDGQMGYDACNLAGKEAEQGPVGAGCGATVGKLIPGARPSAGGVGTASLGVGGATVGAIVAVNAAGDVYHPHTGAWVSGGRLADGTPVSAQEVLCSGVQVGAPMGRKLALDEKLEVNEKFGVRENAEEADMQPAFHERPGMNTTIGVVATDAKLTKEQAARLATVAHDGLARSIRPVHTQQDGDTLFSVATGVVGEDVPFVALCAAAAEVVARAVYNAVIGTPSGREDRP